MAWAIRTMRPDLQLCITAVDTSQEISDFAVRGVYSRHGSDAGAAAIGRPLEIGVMSAGTKKVPA